MKISPRDSLKMSLSSVTVISGAVSSCVKGEDEFLVGPYCVMVRLLRTGLTHLHLADATCCINK